MISKYPYSVIIIRLDIATVRYGSFQQSPSIFEIQSEIYTFKCKLLDPFTDKYHYPTIKGRQFPIVSNSATTGHKLQGSTVSNLLVNDWFYGNNWIYVVLSRVRTAKGLYIRDYLSLDLTRYAMKEEMKLMIHDLKQYRGVHSLTEEEYEKMSQSVANILPEDVYQVVVSDESDVENDIHHNIAF